MIFVTVGTHEQPFNRLIRYIDKMKEKGLIREEVIIQTGYSTYEPRYCRFSKLFPYSEMCRFVKEARIVITHGGPSSFIMPLQEGKIPIVVPRQKRYGEHVNNHQLEFCRAIEERSGNIIVVEEVRELKRAILRYDKIVAEMPSSIKSHNDIFNEEFEKVINELFE
ncbi:MAG: multidrug MFS transporter [Lachnospiraceae bacterium]|jgi:UDP-N-acetylglucosamine transferase subunit ALG13|nr:multidrug MFS transporter [Lachnospiraceae bacterium]MEE1051671.1 glycosyltransferase [Lachnospiraceae bacterium]